MTRKTDLTLSAAGEVKPAPSGSRTPPALIEGAAPNTVGVRLGPTRLCGVCVTLIRQDVRTGSWSHCALGLDHEPDATAYERIRGTIDVPIYSERDRPIRQAAELGLVLEDHGYPLIEVGVTESEQRLMDGNR